MADYNGIIELDPAHTAILRLKPSVQHSRCYVLGVEYGKDWTTWTCRYRAPSSVGFMETRAVIYQDI